MFKVKWAPKCNGVILSEYIEEDEMLHNPRPVYVEELIMLGLDKQFQLPKENVPVCWEIDRKYYYCGELIAETRGGNIYKDPVRCPLLQDRRAGPAGAPGGYTA